MLFQRRKLTVRHHFTCIDYDCKFYDGVDTVPWHSFYSHVEKKPSCRIRTLLKEYGLFPHPEILTTKTLFNLYTNCCLTPYAKKLIESKTSPETFPSSLDGFIH